eukprot:TRINITY_DN70531_c0_g1_i1.p1 TRINITY_DN70531_c0_g1~~TRINITY_DN70531_c0_g1_i1.p1  ORF type:complete len:280 (+),score=45.03 TRINITY_DN70531_c0_g1_i1:44-841(+)
MASAIRMALPHARAVGPRYSAEAVGSLFCTSSVVARRERINAAVKMPSASSAFLFGQHTQRRMTSVSTEATPNPDSIMFYPDGGKVLGEGIKTMSYTNDFETRDESLLANAILKIRGVSEVLLAAKHVTVTKESALSWEVLQPNVELVISQFFSAGLEVVRPDAKEREVVATYGEGSIEEKIVELLEERVRPFVQQDGGDITFERFEPADGIAYLHLQGACKGCPQSDVTLQTGVRNLILHYIPEVKDVCSAATEEEEIPRPSSR